MLIEIDSLDDPRVSPYRNLKDRDLAREGDRFLAEGELVTRRLLASVTHRTESLLLASRRVGLMRDALPESVPCYVAPDAVVNGILGFKFHSGVMAVGVRPAGLPIERVVSAEGPCRLLVCPKVASTDNLGSLVRIAAGFGCDAVVLGEESCDPYYRQSIRVSMGAVFMLPIVRSRDIRSDLRELRDTWRVRLWATVLDEDARPLGSLAIPPRVAVLMGNESAGLERDLVDLCTDRVIVPMKLGVDSLNVAVSAGVFLYELTRGRSQESGR